MSTHDKIASVLTALLSEALGLPVDEVKPNKSFQEYGADSIAVLKMTRGLEETFDAKVTGREMLDYPTVASLSRYLADRLERQIEPGESQSASPTATAGVPDVPVAVEPYPLSKVQEGLWLLQ